jgi:hypothetical protein
VLTLTGSTDVLSASTRLPTVLVAAVDAVGSAAAMEEAVEVVAVTVAAVVSLQHLSKLFLWLIRIRLWRRSWFVCMIRLKRMMY